MVVEVTRFIVVCTLPLIPVSLDFPSREGKCFKPRAQGKGCAEAAELQPLQPL